MNVEYLIISFIPYFLKKYDHQKTGATIDIGVGTFNFYCEAFSKEGFPSYAAEPLPSESFLRIADELKILVKKACITDYNGNTIIYTGKFQGNQLTDLSSLHKNWWGVDSGGQKTEVEAIRLDSFLSEFSIEKISYMKIDTEGSEFEIISQIKELKTSSHPSILEFEYGGGGTKLHGIGGWSEEFFKKTIDSISILSQIGYKHLLVFEREEKHPRYYFLPGLKNYDQIFRDHYHYGNLILFKQKKFNLLSLYGLEKLNSKKLKGIMRIFRSKVF